MQRRLTAINTARPLTLRKSPVSGLCLQCLSAMQLECLPACTAPGLLNCAALRAIEPLWQGPPGPIASDRWSIAPSRPSYPAATRPSGGPAAVALRPGAAASSARPGSNCPGLGAGLDGSPHPRQQRTGGSGTSGAGTGGCRSAAHRCAGRPVCSSGRRRIRCRHAAGRRRAAAPAAAAAAAGAPLARTRAPEQQPHGAGRQRQHQHPLPQHAAGGDSPSADRRPHRSRHRRQCDVLSQRSGQGGRPGRPARLRQQRGQQLPGQPSKGAAGHAARTPGVRHSRSI